MNSKIKLLSILLAVLMLMSQLACVSVSADTPVTSVEYLEDSELEIATDTDTDPYAGCEFADDFYYRIVGEDSVQIMGYVGDEYDLVIPEKLDGYTVTGIGGEAFVASELTSVVIPDTVTTIGSYAFNMSFYLEDITIGENVDIFGCDVFTHTAFYYDLDNWEDGVLYLDNYLLSTYYTTYYETEDEEDYEDEDYFDEDFEIIFDDDFYYDDYEEILFEEPYLRVKDGTTVIADGAFTYAYYLDYIYLPKSIVRIHDCVTSYVDHVLYEGTEEEKSNIKCGDYYLNITKWHCGVADTVIEKSNIIDTTCTVYGKYEIRCTICGQSEEFWETPFDHEKGEKVKVIEPTCSQEGFTVYECKTCGMYMTDDYTYCDGEQVLIKTIDAVCNDYAYEVYKCSDCKETYKEPIWDEFKEHTKGELVKTVEGNCVEDGYSVYKCDDCGETFKDDFVYARGAHSRGEFVERVAPTCEEDGYVVYKCSRCDEEFRDSFVEAYGHGMSNYVRTVKPTCTTDGYDIYKCTKCKEEFKDNYVYADHVKGEFIKTVEPPCGEMGYDVFKCSLCGVEFETNYIDSDVWWHEQGEFVKTVLPTCTEDGYNVYKCVKCGVEYEDEYFSGDLYGHTIGKLIGETKQSCLGSASKNYECAICGEEFETCEYSEEYITHEFVDGSCTECGITTADCVESPHDYSNDMYETYTITKPGASGISLTFSTYTYVEDWYDWITICDSTGEVENYYTGDELAGQTITVEGDTAYIILETDESECFYGFSTTKIEEVHVHKYAETVVKAATCTEKGLKRYTCACGDTYTEEIAPTGHIEVKDNAVAATCTTAGKTAGSHCSVCNKVIVAQKTIPATGHKGVWKVTKKATYFKAGEKTLNCSVCKQTVTEKTAKLKLKNPKVTVSIKNGKLKIDYKKVKGATGFQVSYTYKGTTVTKSFKAKKAATKFLSTLGNGTYKVKVRAVVKKGKNVAYSKWTKAKKLAITKTV